MSGVRSMTGFATLAIEADGGARLTIKSVNHRFLDLALRLPPGCDELEMRLRRLLKERIRRGHVDLTIALEREGSAPYVIDAAALERYVCTLRATAERLNLPEALDVASLARLPGVVSSSQGRDTRLSREAGEQVLAALDPLLAQLDAAREEEGAALARALSDSLALLRRSAEEARGLRAGVRDRHFTRLRERLTQALGASLADNQARLLTEAALLADRSDVEEELLRLTAHLDTFAAALQQGGELGKRLDFLTQEMNREVNTLLSKTGGAIGQDGLKLTEIGLTCKAEIERMREQVQNLE